MLRPGKWCHVFPTERVDNLLCMCMALYYYYYYCARVGVSLRARMCVCICICTNVAIFLRLKHPVKIALAVFLKFTCLDRTTEIIFLFTLETVENLFPSTTWNDPKRLIQVGFYERSASLIFSTSKLRGKQIIRNDLKINGINKNIYGYQVAVEYT